jgi:2-desacetyl-2-hydroxyethyl bacteriochlorophyllide A dehydrogenase
MMSLVNTARGKIELLEQPLPQPGAGQVRIRTAAVGICGTDIEMIDGWERTGYPAIPGHEWAGRVDAAGAGVDAALIGRTCVAENVLRDGGEVGFEHPGAYGQFFITDAANLQFLPDGFPIEFATLIEPLAVCVRGLHRLQIQDRSAALISGDGPIGLLLLMLLKRAGVEELAIVGGQPRRLALARELGASLALNHAELNGASIEQAAGRRFPNVIEASGVSAGMAAALQAASKGAKVLMVGDYGPGTAAFKWNLILHQELELIGTNASAGAWPEAVRLVTEENLPVQRLVTHQFKVPQFAEAFSLVRARTQAIKVLLRWD